jgi:cytochrome d ubiquinol oxidase subunit II
MDLAVLWFFIVGFFFIGYFVLDGFDFGVGMALPFLAKDDTDKRVMINTIGPVWDLNETWLIVAGASLFAAFPYWYATLFDGFYLALLLILLALIVRGVSFEYRRLGRSEQWKSWFDWMIIVGSAVPALLWGVAFANIIQGVAIDETGTYVGTLFDLLNPYGLLGGLTTLMLFFTHGVQFVALKTDGELRERARKLAVLSGLITIVVAASFLVWTVIQHLDIAHLPVLVALAAAAAVSLIGSWIANRAGAEKWAFGLMAATITFAVGSILAALYPYVMPSTIDPAYSLTIANASSSQYTLEVMTWVAVIMLPLVLAYQAFTYWVFRRRITRASIPVAAAH